MAAILAQWWQAFNDVQDQYTFEATLQMTRDHVEVPIFVVALYLIGIFKLPDYLPAKGFKVKYSFAAWNLLLSLFSIVGMYYLGGHLISNLYQNGFKYTVCENPFQWYGRGRPAFWMTLFVFSKIPELLDTFFLVLQRKEVMFLHWFHHLTVLLYCWHAYHTEMAPGIWFGAMNFSVHSVMYFYYFLMGVGYNNIARPVAPFITTMQIAQMLAGSVVIVTSAYWYETGGKSVCYVDAANYKLGLAMYLSYFALFSVLFAEKYLKKGKKTTGGKTNKLCGVDVKSEDSAGMFHGDDTKKPEESETTDTPSKKKKQ